MVQRDIEQQQYIDILNSWIEYLELEKLHNLKVKTEKLEDYKRLSLDNGVTIEENKLTISIPEKLKFSKGDQIYLGFPVLEYKTSYLPLFLIKLNADTELKKIEFDTELFTDFIVAKPVLIRALNFEFQEVDELVKKKPLLSLLKDFFYFSGLKDFNSFSFEKIYKKFKCWLDERVAETPYRVASFDFLITTNKEKDFEYFEGQKVEKVLRDLTRFPFPEENSAAAKYLFGKQKKDFDEYNKSSFVPYFGTFHNFELSKGQALLLQKKAEGENLIAVQGPPGTGKTTVLMAVIASALTERAINIAQNKNDFSTLILIASTANKAVENAAREFEPLPENKCKFKEIPLYAEGYGFYFNGGSSKNINKSLARIDHLIAQLQEKQFNSEEYETTQKDLLSLWNSLKVTAEVLKNLLKELAEIKLLNHSLREIETRLYEISNQSSDLTDLINIDLDELKGNIEKTKNWFNNLNSLGLSLDELPLVADKAFERSIVELKQYLEKGNIVKKIFNFLSKNRKEEIQKFLAKNQKILNILNLNNLLDDRRTTSYLNELENICKRALLLLEEKPDDLYLQNLSYIEKILDLRLKKLKLIKELEIKKKQIEKILKEKKLDLQLSVDKLIKEQLDFLDLWKLVTVEANRNLFIIASKFLYLEALRQKDNVINTLNAFKFLMSNNETNKGREEIKKMGIEKFYQYLSLVYPVHFSSLHSAPYIFEKVKYLLKQKSYKPIHILYIDEAAMALPHLSYPSIYFSQKVISVGDPLQLEPVVALPESDIEDLHQRIYNDNIELINRYSPARTSTYHRTARCETGNYDDFGEACFLDTHRRCQKPIAELFKVVAGYKRLKIVTPTLKEEFKERLKKLGGTNLIFVNVSKGKSIEKNTNLVEIKTIKSLIKELLKVGYSKEEIIVITPFVKQEKLLQKELKSLLKPNKIGTVHKFQGQEAPVVLMSTVVQEGDSTVFIDSKPNLLNVAISRAKHLFIMIGNNKVLQATNYFGKALKFIEKNGKIIQLENELNEK